ncbi:hypothetical protein IJ843_03710 [bacterium]|nr:hypothetical protein [bacterium]
MADKFGNKTGGRQKGTPNRKTKELIELLGDYNPAESLLEILKSDRVPIELKIKINLDLMGYLYPKRKCVESKEQVLLFTNPETVEAVTGYLDI